MSFNYKYSILVLALGLSACSQSNEDLYSFIDEPKSKHLGSVQPLPTFEPYKNFAYSAAELRDPFEPTCESAGLPGPPNILRKDEIYQT